MNRRDNFTCFNIRTFLQSDKAKPIGKDNLTEILSDFICPKNMDVESFLKKNAVEFTKKNQSIDNEKLKMFYDRDNGFKEFETRKSRSGEPYQLIQMLKVI